jgi:pimeloyl-ACP methyl ester carboxylesterase
LTGLIEKLITTYPVDVDEIALIGHSMGGMVLRSACHYGPLSGHGWIRKARHLFFLGSPHLGAPLEKFGNLGTFVLKAVPNLISRLIGESIDRRSEGIKDLRFGYIVDEDWCGADPDGLLQNHRNVVDLPPGVSHYVVAGTLTKDPQHPLTRFLGDSLVRMPSALGKARAVEDSIPFPQSNCRVFYGVGHIALAHHPEVFQQISSWLCHKEKEDFH